MLYQKREAEAAFLTTDKLESKQKGAAEFVLMSFYLGKIRNRMRLCDVTIQRWSKAKGKLVCVNL